MCCPFIWLFQVVWQLYEAELAHLFAFCVAGRDVWIARVSLVCFQLVEKQTPDRVVRQFEMVQEMPPNVDTDDTLHAIDLTGKTKVNWRDKHVGHIQVWNSQAQLLCHGAQLKGDNSSILPLVRRPHYRCTSYYGNCYLSFQILLLITIFVLDVLIIFIYLQVANHKQMLTRLCSRQS